MSAENGTAGINRSDTIASQPRRRSRSSTVSIDRWRTRRFNRHPAARTSSRAIIALAVLATTAMATPSSGPKSSPAASVNAVRGMGTTVTTMWATKNASGNHGPRDCAQSRICTGEGSGSHDASTSSAVMPTTVQTIRDRDTLRAAAPVA